MLELPFPRFDPVLVEIGPIALRFYGLMYVVGFWVGQRLLVKLARDRFLPMSEAQIGNLIVWLVVGVLFGGRIGYVLFYRPELLQDPLELIAVWEGGLSFHGGLLGVIVTFVWFAWRTRTPSWRLGDALALAVVPGIFAVRIANFANGELYGRIASPDVPWAMRFPTDPVAQRLLEVPAGAGMRARELAMLQAFDDGTWERIKERVPLRHPSQLYEALGEGLLLGLLLWGVYRATRARPLGAGAYGGLFLIGYGTVRFVVEFLRQPDAQFQEPGDPLGTVWLGMSMGQVLCLVMILAGGAIFVLGLRRRAAPAAEAVS